MTQQGKALAVKFHLQNLLSRFHVLGKNKITINKQTKKTPGPCKLSFDSYTNKHILLNDNECIHE